MPPHANSPEFLRQPEFQPPPGGYQPPPPAGYPPPQGDPPRAYPSHPIQPRHSGRASMSGSPCLNLRSPRLLRTLLGSCLGRYRTDGLQASFLRWQVRSAEPDAESATPPPSPDGEELLPLGSPVPTCDGLTPLFGAAEPVFYPPSWPPSPQLLPSNTDPLDCGWQGYGWLTESRVTAEILLRGSIITVMLIFIHGTFCFLQLVLP